MRNYRWPEREQNKELPNQHKNTELAGEWQNRHSYCRIDTYNGKIQLKLVNSKSMGPEEILRVIRSLS